MQSRKIRVNKRESSKPSKRISAARKRARSVRRASKTRTFSEKDLQQVIEMAERNTSASVDIIADEIIGILDRHPLFRAFLVRVLRALPKRRAGLRAVGKIDAVFEPPKRKRGRK
jgi:hypothetical protein